MATSTLAGDLPTARQREVLDFLRAFAREKGYAPSMDDIGEAMGFHSRNAAHSHLRALKKKGLVTWEPFKSRSLRVVDDAPDPTALAALRAVLDRCRRAPLSSVDESHPLATRLSYEEAAVLGRLARGEVVP